MPFQRQKVWRVISSDRKNFNTARNNTSVLRFLFSSLRNYLIVGFVFSFNLFYFIFYFIVVSCRLSQRSAEFSVVRVIKKINEVLRYLHLEIMNTLACSCLFFFLQSVIFFIQLFVFFFIFILIIFFFIMYDDSLQLYVLHRRMKLTKRAKKITPFFFNFFFQNSRLNYLNFASREDPHIPLRVNSGALNPFFLSPRSFLLLINSLVFLFYFIYHSLEYILVQLQWQRLM